MSAFRTHSHCRAIEAKNCFQFSELWSADPLTVNISYFSMTYDGSIVDEGDVTTYAVGQVVQTLSKEMSPFAHLLHSLRMRFGIRQSELSALIGYDQTYISALEIGAKGPPPAEFVQKVIRALELSESEQNELHAAVTASLPKLVIDRDSPQELFWMLSKLRERLPRLHPAQIQMITDIVEFPDVLIERRPAPAARLRRRKNEEEKM
jgi:transcriptional regulator with XRE-family HTH domain